ncbi:hypothetical protein V6N13_094721 [Hibiscus sabdariffa]
MDWEKLFAGSEEQSLGFFPPHIKDGLIEVQPPSQVFEEGISEWKNSLVGQFIGSAPNFGTMQKIAGILWGKSLKLGLSYIANAVGVHLYMDSVTASRTRLEFAKVCVELEVDASTPKNINVLLRDGSTAAIRVWIPWMPSRCSNCLENEGGCCWTDSVSPALDIGESSKAVIAIAIVGSFEDVVDDVSDRLVGDAEGDLQAVAVEVVVAPKVPSGVEFPSLQDSVQHKRERGRPAKPKKTNIDDRKVLMEKIQGKKVSCLLRQILGH